MNATQPTLLSDSSAMVPLPACRKNFSGWLTLCLLLIVFGARAESPDDRYLDIFGTIEQGDSLNANGQTSQAHTKYVQAQAALTAFKRENPLWNPRAVAYRLNYLAEKLGATSAKLKPADDSSTTTSQSPRQEKKAGAVGPATVQLKLLSDGSEPRKVLRLHPVAGDKQSLAMSTKTAMTMMMGDTPTPAMKMPVMQLNLDVTVKNVAANGDITYEMLMGDATVASDPEVLPQVAEAMKASVARFHGLSGTGTLSDRGINLGTEIKIPADADAQARQTLDQLKESLSSTAAPLPEEAVGPGAQWEVKSKLKSQGMTIDQTATYEVVSIEEGRITLKCTLAQNAANQKIQSPAMPGLKVDLNKMTGTGTGSTAVDLGKLMPVDGTMDEHTELSMGVNLGGQKQSMTTKVDVNIHTVAN
jgi:hypothetical protein